MQIKKHLIDRATQDGAMERLDTLLSGAYLLVSGASMLTAMAEMLLEKYGMNIGRIKYLMNQVNLHMDRYSTEFSQLVGKHQKEAYFQDVDSLMNLFFTWSQMPKDWKPGDPIVTEVKKDIVIRPLGQEEETISS